ncbi:hypothetical protein J4475_02985, partial [Candidatus Woesearchaeota archaeon]|nr:hypothetical protein [Candidatus Woesearchaeota archaeon]
MAKPETIDQYKLNVNGIVIDVRILRDKDEIVPSYNISILNISLGTQIILNKLREEFISLVNVGNITVQERGVEGIKAVFEDEIKVLIKKYFPNIDDRTITLLINYVIQQNIGLGNIEILLRDPNLEEIVVNNSEEPISVYHKKHGWMITNVKLPSEDRIRHYSTIIGRDVGKEITLLHPLMDAHLKSGDR